MRRSRILVVLLVVCVFGKAQEFLLHKYGTLYKGDELSGYYFLKSEKKSKKEREYGMELYDLNLVLASTVTFSSTAQYTVNETEIADEFLFVRESRQIGDEKYVGRFRIFNIRTGTNVTDVELSNEDLLNCVYYFLPGSIILRQRQVYHKFHWNSHLEMVDIRNTLKWKYELPDAEYPSASMWQFVEKLSGDMIRISVQKSGGNEKGILQEQRILDVKTGKLKLKFEAPRDSKLDYKVISLKEIKGSGFIVYGSYVLSKEDPANPKENCENQGLYFDKYDMNGVLIVRKKYSYEEYFKRAICLERKPEIRHIGNVFIREVFVEDNKISLVMHVDEFPIPKEPGNTMLRTIADNIFIFEIDNNLNFLSWNNLSSTINEKQELLSDQKYLRVRFPEIEYNKDKKLINVIALVKKNKNIGLDKNKFISLIYKKGDPLKIDEVDINGEADITEFYPAKLGYLMVFEYFEKEKRMEKRLIKLSY
jgi:hypothetical protein